MLASSTREVYIGVTANLARRLWEHRNALDPDSYCTRHNIDRLVYFEVTSNVRAAIRREKQLKPFHRKEKLQLIETLNPDWRDLAETCL